MDSFLYGLPFLQQRVCVSRSPLLLKTLGLANSCGSTTFCLRGDDV